MEKRLPPVVVFFIATFIWTWACYFTIVAYSLDPYSGIGLGLLILGGCSPTFVGIIMVLLTYDKEQRIDYFKRTYQVKNIKPFWWLFIILVFPVIYLISIGAGYALDGSLPQMSNLKAIIASPLLFFPLISLSFLSGPFSEELGWRGFSLDPLLRRFGFVGASIILGIIWGAWHLPLYFMPQMWHGQMGFGFNGFWAFMLDTVGLSCMMSWVYINTKRSILSAMLMHLFSNFTGQLLEEIPRNVQLIHDMLVFLFGVGLCIYMLRPSRKLEPVDHGQ